MVSKTPSNHAKTKAHYGLILGELCYRDVMLEEQ